MRLDRYTLLLGIAALSMTGCSTGRYASAPVAHSSHAAAPAPDYYDADPTPVPAPAPVTEPKLVLPLPTTNENIPVKSVGLMSILSQGYKRQCVEEPCTPSVNCDSRSTCVVPEQPCCSPQVGCAEPRKKSLFDCWHWPTKQTSCVSECYCEPTPTTCCTLLPTRCAPLPLYCAPNQQCCVTEPQCAENATCAVPEQCCPVTSQGCSESNGCCDTGKHMGMMTYIRERLFWKPKASCAPQPSCVDECTMECGDRCGNTCSPLLPQCRNAPCRPSHGGSPLAPCLEDPFVRHEQSTQAERTADAPADVTAPIVPAAPEFNDDAPQGAQETLPVPQADKTIDPIPLSSAPQYVRPQTYIEPQFWPRLKIAPVVSNVRQPGTFPTSWSR